MAHTRTSNHAILINGTREAKDQAFRENQWGMRHYEAWQHPRKGAEAMIKALIVGWAEYADQYHQSTGFDAPETISEDSYTSQYWLSIGENIIGLLSNETGRFDCGTLDSLVRRIAMNEGFSNDLT
ncbi:hypothetical protein KC963_05105 [Candidatus Saccharibacteria bacterium]|nr:hypothetical protein [Candidatus Saccharibacteria bacterium]